MGTLRPDAPSATEPQNPADPEKPVEVVAVEIGPAEKMTPSASLFTPRTRVYNVRKQRLGAVCAVADHAELLAKGEVVVRYEGGKLRRDFIHELCPLTVKWDGDFADARLQTAWGRWQASLRRNRGLGIVRVLAFIAMLSSGIVLSFILVSGRPHDEVNITEFRIYTDGNLTAQRGNWVMIQGSAGDITNHQVYAPFIGVVAGLLWALSTCIPDFHVGSYCVTLWTFGPMLWSLLNLMISDLAFFLARQSTEIPWLIDNSVTWFTVTTVAMLPFMLHVGVPIKTCGIIIFVCVGAQLGYIMYVTPEYYTTVSLGMAVWSPMYWPFHVVVAMAIFLRINLQNQQVFIMLFLDNTKVVPDTTHWYGSFRQLSELCGGFNSIFAGVGTGAGTGSASAMTDYSEDSSACNSSDGGEICSKPHSPVELDFMELFGFEKPFQDDAYSSRESHISNGTSAATHVPSPATSSVKTEPTDSRLPPQTASPNNQATLKKRQRLPKLGTTPAVTVATEAPMRGPVFIVQGGGAMSSCTSDTRSGGGSPNSSSPAVPDQISEYTTATTNYSAGNPGGGLHWVTKGVNAPPPSKKTKFTTMVAEAAPVSAIHPRSVDLASLFQPKVAEGRNSVDSVAAGMISSALVSLSASSDSNTLAVITTASSMKLPVVMARPDGSMAFQNELFSILATEVGVGDLVTGLAILGKIIEWFGACMKLKGENHLFASSASFRNSGSMQLDVLGTIIQCRDPGMEMCSIWVIHNHTALQAALQVGAGLAQIVKTDTVVVEPAQPMSGTLDLRSKWQQLAGSAKV